ncbi:ATP-binding protein [Geomonas sp.]|uniref:ATP-binding protein n=1 Tax=Geomonas sp. TaxID=2651584 RepID=UPI002B49B594|nr:ATP-binding protein [Geomonas sp.]HJV34609.1 ATP-binding protein [Geomonas sp.]
MGINGMKSASKTLHLSIESKLSDVALLGHAVRGVCACSPLQLEAYGEMEVCVVEAVNNAIAHAYRNEVGYRVDTWITLHHDRIVFEISDSGQAIEDFAPRTLEFDPEEIGSIPENGMGLFIIETLMDEVSYRSENGTNTLSFCRYFRQTSA